MCVYLEGFGDFRIGG